MINHRFPELADSGGRKTYAALFLALMLGFLGYWLLNQYVFPLFDPIFIWAREISAAAGGLTLVAIALVAAWRPSLFKGLPVISGIQSIVLAGALLMVCGFYFDSIALLLAGAWLSTVASGLVSVVTGISCTKMGLRGTGICVAAAYLVAYALRWAFIALPPGVGLCVYIVAPVIALALVTPHARSLLAYIFAAEAPAQAAVTRPASFIPFSNQVFVCLVLFRFVYGYMLTFGEIGRVPLLAGFTVVPLVALLLVMVLEKGALNPDRLFPAAVLCIVAGFLALSADGRNSSLIVNTLLSSGVGLFEVLLLSLFVILSSKNRANALVIFSWVYALNSLATLVGANFGRFTNRYYEVDSVVTSFLGAAVVLVFVAYILIVLKDFSFKRTVEGVENIEPAAAASAPDSARQIEGGCEALGSRFDLTAREREVFYLLARGRNSKVIQEELHISYNTAKAHVRHIYTKLGVHTQQELIDLVEHPGA